MANETVFITGVGLLCSLGRDYEAVIAALRSGSSGIRSMPEWAQLGLRAAVGGPIAAEHLQRGSERLPSNARASMSEAARLCSLAALDALEDADLSVQDCNRVRSACVVGSSVGSTQAIYAAAKKLYEGAARRISPHTVLQAMCSCPSSSVATVLGLRGRSYSLSSACATSAHCIGHASELIRSGLVDVAIAGGGDECSEQIAASFDAMRMALSSHFNAQPQLASRPYDAARDGFVLSGGAGIVVLESARHLEQRRGRARARLVGFGASTGPEDLVLPDVSGAASKDCIQEALASAALDPRQIDAVNTHGTATVMGDLSEVNALRAVFGANVPPFSSTKSMTGHALGGAGALETIFCVGMLEQRCILPSINIEAIDPKFADMPIARQCEPHALEYVLTNSFGFGGTNAALVLQRT